MQVNTISQNADTQDKLRKNGTNFSGQSNKINNLTDLNHEGGTHVSTNDAGQTPSFSLNSNDHKMMQPYDARGTDRTASDQLSRNHNQPGSSKITLHIMSQGNRESLGSLTEHSPGTMK